MSASHPLDLSSLVQRLGSLPSFNIYALGPEDTAEPWLEVDMREVCQQLVVQDTDLARDIGAIAVQVVHWGRLEAQARRVWQVFERRYRSWRSAVVLRASQAPLDAEALKWKKPTEGQIEAMCRAAPEYARFCRACEGAEEAYNAAKMVREAFLAKRDMLRVAVRASSDHSGPRLSV